MKKTFCFFLMFIFIFSCYNYDYYSIYERNYKSTGVGEKSVTLNNNFRENCSHKSYEVKNFNNKDINVRKNKNIKMLKVLLTNVSGKNYLNISPNENYEIYVGQKLKGEILKGQKYKFGIYGARIVVSKQKVYDEEIYLKAKGIDAICEINNKKYRGNFFISVCKNKFSVVNHIELEKYICGVVSSEMPISFPMEALKAQAVLARTYVIKKISNSHVYDVDDTVKYQVYSGLEKETKEGNEATFSTLGEVIFYKDKIADVFYHSTCGGHTDSSKAVWGNFLDYVVGIRCNYCKSSPHYNWKKFISFETIKSVLNKNNYDFNRIKKIKIKSFSKAGRTRELTILTDKGSFDIFSSKFRNMFDNLLKSSNFRIIDKSDGVLLEGRGYGHAVGMCQYGANGLAEKGYSYKKIIKYYFQGVKIDKWMN